MNPSSICLDATLVLQLLLDNEDQKVLGQWKAWSAAGTTLIAPSLMAYEVVGAFGRLVSNGRLKADEASDLLGLFFKLGITFHGDGLLHSDALNLATELKLDDGDLAHYLALAKRFDAEFWTLDQELLESIGPKVPYLKVL